jgi:bifunctional DNase/RNase
MRRHVTVLFAGALLLFLVSVALFCVGKEASPAFVEMEVKGVRLDAVAQNPVVVLADKDGKRAFPIWIGLLEANAIDKELKNTTSVRPMTHDLLYSILGHAQAKVKEVKIVDLKDHTYYATLFISINKKVIEVDARPSDAIIIALKSKAPIYIAARILSEQGISFTLTEASGERHGIRIQELTPDLADHFNFKGNKGVLVSEVVPESASESSGIKSGDIIAKIDLKEVGSVEEFEEALDASKDVKSIRISLFRDGKTKEINLVLKP